MSERFDVIVVGSGGAGLLCACVAADRGLRVAVLEASAKVGGTTAVSGGLIWIPGNPLMEESGHPDSREDALRYLTRLAAGEVPLELVENFVDTGPEMIRYLIEQTPVQLEAIEFPDYHPEWDGARQGWRTMDNEPFPTAAYEGLTELVREGPHFPLATYRELHEWRWPEQYDWELIASRMMDGTRTLGGALAAALAAGGLQRGVQFLTESPVSELVHTDGRVAGVIAQRPDGSHQRYEATQGVVLASGGYEWHPRMLGNFLRGPVVNAVSPPWNAGAGIRMALPFGAALGNMSHAWWVPTFNVPGEEYDGQPLSRLATGPLGLPGSVMVNRRGRRFVNEAMNYSDQGHAFHYLDVVTYERPNIPAWLIFDQRFKDTYPVAAVMPSDPAPPWVPRADSLADLAREIEVDPAGLAETVATYNEYAREGRDPDFGRGDSAYDRYHGDPRHRPNPCMGPLEVPPYYALEIKPGTIGTKGGLVTDTDGRVLTVDGPEIPGLFACSNVIASPMGPGYPGAGGTLGPALVGGYCCGQSVGKS